MPDMDVVERTIHRRWRKTYRMIKGRQPLPSLKREILVALADQLRSGGGIPPFDELVRIVTAPRSQGNSARLAGDAVREIERRFARNANVEAAARGVQRISARIAAGQALPNPASVAEESCWNLLDSCILGRLDRLVGPKGTFSTPADLEEFCRGLRLLIVNGVHDTARRLVSNPSAAGLRAPRIEYPKLTTRELLDEVVESRQ